MFSLSSIINQVANGCSGLSCTIGLSIFRRYRQTNGISTVVQVNARAGAWIPARSWTASAIVAYIRCCEHYRRESEVYIKYTCTYSALGFVGKRWERVRERSKPAGSLSPGMTTAHGPSIDLGEHCAPERAALEASLLYHWPATLVLETDRPTDRPIDRPCWPEWSGQIWRQTRYIPENCQPNARASHGTRIARNSVPLCF